jgi:hypothetical protein
LRNGLQTNFKNFYLTCRRAELLFWKNLRARPKVKLPLVIAALQVKQKANLNSGITGRHAVKKFQKLENC